MRMMKAVAVFVYGQSSGPVSNAASVPVIKNNVAVAPELQKYAAINTTL